MASPVLHIKDSYYFEVPKALRPADYTGKEFPHVWVRLDPQFQLWEAERLYEGYKELKQGDVASFETLKDEYLEWKHDHHNAGKPFDRFLDEHYDQEWFAEQLQDSSFARQWNEITEVASGREAIREFQADSTVAWSPEKVEGYNKQLSGKILIPQPFGELRNLYERDSGFCVSKFMVLELVVALILCAAFAWLARRVEKGERPRGRTWNFLELFVVFVRDQVARPAIGKHDADRFVPILLTLFFFILGCNLLGMIPWLGAPTASWGATFGLACVTFGTVLVSGMRRFGPIGFFVNMAPKFDLRPKMGGVVGLLLGTLAFVFQLVIQVFILAIEVLGLCIRHVVLSIRLLANMVAGHIVLLAIMMLAFSVQGAMSESWTVTAFIAVIGSTLFSCLELFVAFLQAYIFTFLSALFIGSAIHHH